MRILNLSFLIILLFGIASLAAYSQTASVVSENANLRGTPTNDGKVVETLPKDSQIEVIKQKGAWFLVQSSDYVGWIHGNTIRLEKNSASKSSPIQKNKAERGIQIGMTTRQVRESDYGSPSEINRTLTANGTQEQWVYDRYRFGTPVYLYFVNDRLISIRY